MAVYVNIHGAFVGTHYGESFGLHIAGWIMVLFGCIQLRRVVALNEGVGNNDANARGPNAAAVPRTYSSGVVARPQSVVKQPNNAAMYVPQQQQLAQTSQVQYYAAPAPAAAAVAAPADAPPPYEEEAQQQEGQPASAPPFSS